MWSSIVKFLAVLFVKNRLDFIKRQFFNKHNTHANEDLNRLKESIAAMAENRAALFKHNFNDEVHRVVNSLFGFMLILLAAIFSVLTGLMWLFASAWNSPNRDIILSISMFLPLIIALGIYLYIRHTWQKQPIMHHSITQIENDWQVFRTGFDSSADNETNNAAKPKMDDFGMPADKP